ncbi:10345_t:CDS:1, partial [Racocetra fulgida]
PDDILWVNNQIREQYSLIQKNFKTDNSDSNNEDNLYIDNQERSTKKLCKKTNKDLTDFSKYYDSSNEEDSLDEIRYYLAHKISKDTDLDILEW